LNDLASHLTIYKTCTRNWRKIYEGSDSETLPWTNDE